VDAPVPEGYSDADEQDAYATAAWLQRSDHGGSLSGFLNPTLTAFAPTDSVSWNYRGWRIRDESAGNRVKICFYQHGGWNSVVRPRDAFGSWWQEAFGGNYGGKVVNMPDASFSTLNAEVIAAWRVTDIKSPDHKVFMTLRPMDMGFHQEMAFIHNIHSCYGGGNNDNRHHHIYWADFWEGGPWYIFLAELPKPRR
jgi:hypothetical protein